MVALTSPLLGGIADRAGIRRPLFIGLTAMAVTATALMATVQPGMVIWGFVLGVVGNIGYESALVVALRLSQPSPRGSAPQLERPRACGRGRPNCFCQMTQTGPYRPPPRGTISGGILTLAPDRA